MILRATDINGVTIVDVEELRDERGFFARVFDADVLRAAGLTNVFPQQSIAYNANAGTIRGLHYQVGEAPEAKIVRCTRGALFDVVVDLRAQSPTFGQWFGTVLDDRDRRALYVPAGCAHGYQTLEDHTEAFYSISTPYVADLARGVHYADPVLKIQWPREVTTISRRDASLPSLESAELPITQGDGERA